ncbi:hypothetical protein Tsubulata_042725, partial [Turnera subulata]
GVPVLVSAVDHQSNPENNKAEGFSVTSNFFSTLLTPSSSSLVFPSPISSPWKCCLRPPVPGPGLSPRRVPGFSTPPNDRIQFLRLKRIHVRDPYKRLGISREASEEEIIAARNYLIQKYAGHKPSVDSIEKAHNKIIYQHFSDRRKDKKINIFKKFREVRQSRPLQGARSMFRNPATREKIIAASWYIVPLLLTFADGTEEGPTFAVGLSLVAAMLSYLRRKEWFQAFIYGTLTTSLAVDVFYPQSTHQYLLHLVPSLPPFNFSFFTLSNFNPSSSSLSLAFSNFQSLEMLPSTTAARPGPISPSGSGFLYSFEPQYSISPAEEKLVCSRSRSFFIVSTGTAVFPRIHVRDPYKRLGISREASEEEINAARNYLIQKYAGHKPSVDSIEKAHNKIIYQHFSVRKDQKVSIFKMFREVGQSRALQGVRSMFQTPDTGFLFQTALVFIVLAFITVRFPTEEGPAAQVTLSLLATMYCLYSRHKNPLRAFIYGAGACIVSWLIATFLMVTVMTVIPTLPFVKGLRGFMVTTSLISYVLLWFFSAYLK